MGRRICVQKIGALLKAGVSQELRYTRLYCRVRYGSLTSMGSCRRKLLCRRYICFRALIFTPGPIVEAVTQLLMYWPFAAAGFALIIAVMRA